MVSYSNPLPMYPKNHGFNYWYNYSTSHHANNQYLPGSAGSGGSSGLGGVSGIGTGLDGDPSAASSMYYNHHHAMFQQPSPDYSGHDTFAFAAATQNSPLLQSSMGHTSNALHLNHHHHNNSVENLSNGMQNIPPSPPITVNSGCSEMSSPGITNGGGMGNGSSPPHMTNGNCNLSRPKSPYEWMKKPSYQSQSQPGKTHLMQISLQIISHNIVLQELGYMSSSFIVKQQISLLLQKENLPYQPMVYAIHIIILIYF